MYCTASAQLSRNRCVNFPLFISLCTLLTFGYLYNKICIGPMEFWAIWNSWYSLYLILSAIVS